MDKIIQYMLDEDKGFGDITSQAVVDESKEVSAHIVSKDEGILAGMNIIREVFEEFDVNVTFPEEYTEELAGKDAVFTITINSKINNH